MVSRDVAVYDSGLRFVHASGLEKIQGSVAFNHNFLLKGYKPANPEGYSILGGGRWEYVQGTGVVEGDVACATRLRRVMKNRFSNR